MDFSTRFESCSCCVTNLEHTHESHCLCSTKNFGFLENTRESHSNRIRFGSKQTTKKKEKFFRLHDNDDIFNNFQQCVQYSKKKWTFLQCSRREPLRTTSGSCLTCLLPRPLKTLLGLQGLLLLHRERWGIPHATIRLYPATIFRAISKLASW